MNIDRSFFPMALSMAAVTATGLSVMALRALTKSKASPFPRSALRESTGGCEPDVGTYVDAQITLSNVDGAHQGIAVALLRDRFVDTDSDAAPFTLEYDETFRSCVEVALCLALNLAEAEIADECDCDEDDDCDSTNIESGLLALVAGRKFTEFAMTFEHAAARHAQECTLCASEGSRAPTYLRATFCRDLADDMFVNFNSNEVSMRGVPIPAALDVISAMVEFIEQAHDTPVDVQIGRLTVGVAQSIAHDEGHATQV